MNRRSFLWRAFCSSLPLFARSGVSERLHAPVVSKPSDATLAAFAHGLAGRVFRPGDKQYEQLRKGYAAKFDAHPALVVSPANTRDIQATLGFASSHRLPLAIRLLAAQISFRRQHANMTKEELNLFQFPAIHMTELCAGSPEIVWSEMVQLHPLSAPSDDVPDDILGYPLTPRRPMSAYCSEDSACGHLRRFPPSIDCLLDASRHRNGADMTTLANKIHYGPMSLPDLQIIDRKRRELGPAQSAADKHGNHRKITATAQIVTICFFQ